MFQPPLPIERPVPQYFYRASFEFADESLANLELGKNPRHLLNLQNRLQSLNDNYRWRIKWADRKEHDRSVTIINFFTNTLRLDSSAHLVLEAATIELYEWMKEKEIGHPDPIYVGLGKAALVRDHFENDSVLSEVLAIRSAYMSFESIRPEDLMP